MHNDCNILSLCQYLEDSIKILVKSLMEEDFFEKLLTLYIQMFTMKMDCSLFPYGSQLNLLLRYSKNLHFAERKKNSH